MSTLLAIPGTAQPPTQVKLTTTTLTDIITATDQFDTVVSISLANETAGAVVCNVYRNDGVTDFLTFAKSVPANDTSGPFEVPIRLLNGHKIKAQAPATANAITVTVVKTKTVRQAS